MVTRRRLMALSTAAFAPLVLAQETGGAKGKKNNKKTVTQTFSNFQSVDIQTFSTRNSQITVNGLKQGRILDVDVILNGYTHTLPDDVDLLLVAPDGKNALILSDSGAAFGVSDITLTLDDEAAEVLPDNDQLVAKSYRPANFNGSDGDMFLNPVAAPAPALSGSVALSTFDGIDPNGVWTLFVTDDNAGDNGVLADGWTLRITAQVKKKKKKK